VFTKIIGQIVGFKRTGSKLVSGVTWHIKSEKVNIQLLGPNAQNIHSSRPAFYFIPAKQEADTGVNAGDLVLIRLAEKSKRKQFEIAAKGRFRSRSGVTLIHQIQLLGSEMTTGVYAVAPATALQRGEFKGDGEWRLWSGATRSQGKAVENLRKNLCRNSQMSSFFMISRVHLLDAIDRRS
jgi:hypothetical protein